MEKEKIIDPTGIELKPGEPEICSGNGEHVDENGELIECCCDECDHYLKCFPNSENEEKQPTVRR